MSIQIHTPNLMSISFKKDDRKVKKTKFKKENIWCAIRSNPIKVKLDLYYVKTNSYTKFQINISKDCREKSGKQNFSKGR